ncbi:TIGR02611 family protein [Streptomyces sp. NPDC047108]|uniref:TIGR02611 family protein n=1 Tax=Streptomyces sp. NPDC047108 TaxID=3155025 RepID=UPI0033EAFE57
MNAESDERQEAAGVAATGPTGDGMTGDAMTGTGATAVGGQLGSKAPQFIKASKPLHLSWQVGVFLVGLAVVAGGVIMLPLPGPGWLVIFAGMAIWATEFVWAQLVLRWTKRKVTEAAHRALDPRVRRRNIILTAIGLAIIAGGVAVYIANYGLMMPWHVAR